MILFLVLSYTGVAVSSFLAHSKLKKIKELMLWDQIYPFTGLVCWMLMAILNLGAAVTLSNFVIENLCLIVISAAVPWIVTLLYKRKQKSCAKLLCFFPLVFCILLRLTIKSLPE